MDIDIDAVVNVITEELCVCVDDTLDNVVVYGKSVTTPTVDITEGQLSV